MKIKVLSIDVTPNKKCFQIEYRSELGSLYSSNSDVINMSSIEDECYDLDGASVTSQALDMLVMMNSRHLNQSPTL